MTGKEADFRDKITWFTFFFSILVIWVHSNNAELFLGNTEWAGRIEMVERFFGDTVAQIAVPGFFMISSYLFFRGFTMKQLLRKWNSRIQSILVPFIVWNTLYYLGYAVGSRLPVAGEIIGKGKIPLSLPVLVEAITHYTYNYVFWYLYQLILLILLAPVIYLIVKGFWTGLAFLSAILLAIYLGAALSQLNLDALFYYSFAAFFSFHSKAFVEGRWTYRRAGVGITLIAAGVFVSAAGLSESGAGGAAAATAAATVILRCSWPAGLWLLWPDPWIPETKSWMKNNFFLYAAHFAMVRMINKTGAWLLPSVPLIPLGFFLIMPVLIVFLSDKIGSILKRYLPVTWRLLNGGR